MQLHFLTLPSLLLLLTVLLPSGLGQFEVPVHPSSSSEKQQKQVSKSQYPSPQELTNRVADFLAQFTQEIGEESDELGYEFNSDYDSEAADEVQSYAKSLTELGLLPTDNPMAAAPQTEVLLHKFQQVEQKNNVANIKTIGEYMRRDTAKDVTGMSEVSPVKEISLQLVEKEGAQSTVKDVKKQLPLPELVVTYNDNPAIETKKPTGKESAIETEMEQSQTEKNPKESTESPQLRHRQKPTPKLTSSDKSERQVTSFSEKPCACNEDSAEYSEKKPAAAVKEESKKSVEAMEKQDDPVEKQWVTVPKGCYKGGKKSQQKTESKSSINSKRLSANKQSYKQKQPEVNSDNRKQKKPQQQAVASRAPKGKKPLSQEVTKEPEVKSDLAKMENRDAERKKDTVNAIVL